MARPHPLVSVMSEPRSSEPVRTSFKKEEVMYVLKHASFFDRKMLAMGRSSLGELVKKYPSPVCSEGR